MADELDFTRSVDWITATLDIGLYQTQLGNYPMAEKPSSNSFYSTRYEVGVGISWEIGRNKTQGNKLTITGKGFEYIQSQDSLPSWDILRNVAQIARNITRVDIAYDLRGEGAPSVLGLVEIMTGGLENVKKTVTQTHALKNADGNTIYIGKRTSEVYTRFYDKAAEQCKHGVTWTRLEMELKKRRARQVAHMSTTDVITQADVILPYALGVATLPQSALDLLKMPSQPEKMPLKAPETSYEKWLAQIEKSIKQSMQDEARKDHVIAFINRLNLLLP